MIFGCVIYLTYSPHDKNIPHMISGQGHLMRLSQGQSLKILNKNLILIVLKYI